jgi:DNA-binding transcriptional LysR family regulator
MPPLRFTLRQLEYFVAVGQAGSIALAAQRIHVSPPSISTSLTQLEAEFGLPLFVRRPAQGLTLTQSGRQFMQAALTVLADAGRLNELAGTITGTVGGPLAIGCLVTIAQVILPRLRQGFVARHPGVSFLQSEGDQAALYDALRHGTLDAALTYDLSLPSDLEFTPLAILPPHVILPQAHPLAAAAVVSLADLAPLPMVLLDLPHSADYFLRLFSDAGLRPRITDRTRDMGVMRSLVGADFGYSIANIQIATTLAPDGSRLCIRPIAPPVQPMTLGLVTIGGGQNALTTRAFLDHCRAVMAAGALPGILP